MNKSLLEADNKAYSSDCEMEYFGSAIPATLLDPSKLNAKRAMDLAIAGMTFISVFSCLYPVLWVLIKCSSKGPVFFKQLRHGKDNIPFYCYKFRTMVVNDHADSLQAVKQDPRITTIGKFLRRTSLDELPQILNVLKGEMSIVGPRPHPIQLNERFSKDIKHLMCRHVVKPGITGLAQAKGYRGETSEFFQMHSRCRLDMFYVKNWSLWLDTKIIALTLWASIKNRENAY